MAVLTNQRHLFDIPDDIAYFNCSYYSPLLKASRDALHEGVIAKTHPWTRTAQDFFDDAERIRNLESELFGGDPDGYAIVPSASYGISTAARIMEERLKSGDEILLIDEGFPSNVLPWKRATRVTGAVIITAPTPQDNKGWTQTILEGINSKTKIVAVPQCHWTNGAFIDLVEIGKRCREIDAVLVVDATQALGAMPLSMDVIQPDFLVASGYKWLLSPYGFTLFYIAPEWRNERPLEENWQGRENAEDFTSLVNYSENYLPGSRRFDVGEKGTSTILPGAIKALEQLKNWSIASIAETLDGINHQISTHLLEIGFSLPDESQRCPHMFGARLPEGLSVNLVSEMKKQNIYISQRGSAVRFAPHVYINQNDLDRLFTAFEKIL